MDPTAEPPSTSRTNPTPVYKTGNISSPNLQLGFTPPVAGATPSAPGLKGTPIRSTLPPSHGTAGMSAAIFHPQGRSPVGDAGTPSPTQLIHYDETGAMVAQTITPHSALREHRWERSEESIECDAGSLHVGELKEDRDGNDSEHGNAGDGSVGKTSNAAIPGDYRLSGSSSGDDGSGKPEESWNWFDHANDGRWAGGKVAAMAPTSRSGR